MKTYFYLLTLLSIAPQAFAFSSWCPKAIPPIAQAMPIPPAPVKKFFNYTTAQQYGTQALNQALNYGTQAVTISGKALSTAGSFIKATATAHPYATLTLGAYAAAGAYLWYQHGKHARLVKNLEAKQAHNARHGLPQGNLLNQIAQAERKANHARQQTLTKHIIARPYILAPCLIGGALALAIGFDIAKTSLLTQTLSVSRFMLPEYAINLLPKATDGKIAAASFAGYKEIFKFARQQYFKPSDLAIKTTLGATGGLLYFMQRWIKLRNGSVDQIY